jgi:hypothetical protein
LFCAARLSKLRTNRFSCVCSGSRTRGNPGQKKIAAAKLDFDLYEKRYAVFEAARRLLIKAVQDGDLDAKQVITFKIETIEAVFLFDQDIMNYLNGLSDKVLRFRSLRAQEKAADEYEEEKKEA